MPQELDNNSQQAETNLPETQESKTPTLEDIENLQKALNKERQEKTKLEKDVKRYETHLKEYNPDEFKRLQELKQKWEERDVLEQQRIAGIKSEFEQEKSALLKENNDLRSQLQKTTATYELEKAFFNAGGLTASGDGISHFDMILPHALNHVKIEDGKITVIDPATGTKKFTKEGTPFTLADLMMHFRQSGATAQLFKPANNAGGTGANPNRTQFNGDRETFLEQTKNLPRSQRLTLLREQGIDQGI
jgi:predicted RNase H-like nuclease (RuvC/YqgF family)